MLVERFAENPIIKPCDVPPSRDDYEVVGAFNPAATIFNDEILLLCGLPGAELSDLHRFSYG